MRISDTRAKASVTKDPFRSAAQSGGLGVPDEQLHPETQEASQRVGMLAEIPSLLRELGADPSEVMASAGLDTDTLDTMENRIPFVTVGRLLQHCAMNTRCQHFALLLGQRSRLSHLGLPGQSSEALIDQIINVWGKA